MRKYYNKQMAKLCAQYGTTDLSNVLRASQKANLNKLANYMYGAYPALPYVTHGLGAFKVNQPKCTRVTWLYNVTDLSVATHGGALVQAVHAGVVPMYNTLTWQQYGYLHFGTNNNQLYTWVFSDLWVHMHAKGHVAWALATRIHAMVANGYVVPNIPNHFMAMPAKSKQTCTVARQFGLQSSIQLM